MLNINELNELAVIALNDAGTIETATEPTPETATEPTPETSWNKEVPACVARFVDETRVKYVRRSRSALGAYVNVVYDDGSRIRFRVGPGSELLPMQCADAAEFTEPIAVNSETPERISKTTKRKK